MNTIPRVMSMAMGKEYLMSPSIPSICFKKKLKLPINIQCSPNINIVPFEIVYMILDLILLRIMQIPKINRLPLSPCR